MVAQAIASALGSTEGAIKLLISLFLGYPLAMLYRSPVIYNLSPNGKHIFFILIGLLLSYYNFGVETIHLIINVSFIYVLLAAFGGTKFSVIFAFAFNTSYLVISYYFQMKSQFGISWTMPLCVITLRLTGVAFDFYDGQKKNIPPDAKDTYLSKRPSFLELMGHTFFFGGVMVGPQISMKRYLMFTNGEYSDLKAKPPQSGDAALRRFLGGFAYIVLYQVIALCLPDSYLNSSSFYNQGFFTKCVLIVIWGKNALHKYLGVWLVAEGSIILTGLSHNGRDENGNLKWDACTNVKVYDLETGESFHDFIASFNVNTNQWMSRYVFKRLRFLGNKLVSQLITLFYLALWHGLQSGYYMCFFLELLETNTESQLRVLFSKCRERGYIPPLDSLCWLGRFVRKFLLIFLWAYALVGFVLHDYDKWVPIYNSVYWIGHVGCVVVLLGVPFILSLLPKKIHTNGVHVETQGSKKEL